MVAAQGYMRTAAQGEGSGAGLTQIAAQGHEAAQGLRR